VKVFDADKTRMIGLPSGEKLLRYLKPFSSDTGTLRTDRQTDRRMDRRTDLLYQYRAMKMQRPSPYLKFKKFPKYLKSKFRKIVSQFFCALANRSCVLISLTIREQELSYRKQLAR